MQEEQKTEIEIQRADFIASLGLTIKAEFVPFRESRNKDNEYKSLNWIITLVKNDRDIITFEYMQGSGHIPECGGYDPRGSLGGHKKTYVSYVCEYGLVPALLNTTRGKPKKPKKLPKFDNGSIDWFKAVAMVSGGSYTTTRTLQIAPPELIDLLYSLCMDSDCLEYTFEDWADNLGYDTDSMKARATYDLCIEQSIKLKQCMSHNQLEELKELFQDY